ncbi:hypothetical protein GSF27_10730 [Pseudomaricurvus sp. HS19]|nr:hypothetical protein [Pseudomaricurvus sp. HS19]
MYNKLDHVGVSSLSELSAKLEKYGCDRILIKKLVKNNNDKNQVYFHHDASLLNSIFDLTFHNREPSTSKKKKGRIKGRSITEAIFNSYSWLSVDDELHQVPHCKGILYLQYPEVRLSGFSAESGLMPESMSVAFTKQYPDKHRYLAIGATPEGAAIAVILAEPSEDFHKGFDNLPYMENSKICKKYEIKKSDSSQKLKRLLQKRISGRDIKGCRLSTSGETLPFTGTQVHGYTLEHELGIATNASKDGDIFGIELKCFTSPKLTLFTPEPDGGLYAKNFPEFMCKYGYLKNEVYRLSGLHRAGQVCEKSNLTLQVVCTHKSDVDERLGFYNPKLPLSHQMKNLQVVLCDDDGEVAASWSMNRLLNNWGVKHNEAVYVPARVSDNHIQAEVEAGFTRRVWFGDKVLWCKKTSLELMIKAIASGVIFLDPAPKYDADNPRNNKRRSQWRINNIYRDSKFLYRQVEEVEL